MKLIESKTLGTAQASIEFTSIPQTFTDLLLVFSMRADVGATYVNTAIRFNSDSGSNYSYRMLYGLGSGSGLNAAETQTSLRYVYSTGTVATSNTFGNAQVYIPNYTGSTAKSVSMDSVSENNATEAIQALTNGLWSGTAAITTLTLTTQAGPNLLAGSTASLYGILKGSDGIVTTS
jgi:hypothetical protein